MIDSAAAQALVSAWDEGWNDGDVDRIMAPFADDVVFTSPFVSRVGTDAATDAITGEEALRAYVIGALERTPGIRYTVDAVYLGTDSIVIEYTVSFPDGRPDTPGADLLRIDAAGKVVEWRSHYLREFIEARLPPPARNTSA